MGWAFRAMLWTGVVMAEVLCSPQAAWAADTTRLEISGTLIKPPCTATFASTQSVEVPKVNLNSLQSRITPWTDVEFGFQCAKHSRVQLRFTSGSGTYDPHTMRTTLDTLGLQTQLSDVSAVTRQVAMTLGESLLFDVPDEILKLKFSVRAVKTGEQLPAIGNYNAILLLEVLYL
ncbi:fimbrial protein [Pseudomonas orientalis]|uniref:fimbrial protein n=1 Tax=Pseudomonas orientalis TaxID=76758 RepID=UPI001FAF41F8|nr:fimbrial protein [Pseudomonas orientalis]MDF2793337.1 fimbrial protein [Pseudomonas orientalis]UOB22181.1 fimbrial protein [Pseudomonas orientalis]